MGRHQLRNVALAIAAAEQVAKKGFTGIAPESIERGIRDTSWPGRFQVIEHKAEWPEVVLDVAHNPAGAWALRSALSERYGDRPLIFVFGAMRDKAISEIAKFVPDCRPGHCHTARKSARRDAGRNSAGSRQDWGGDRLHRRQSRGLWSGGGRPLCRTE